MVWKSINVLKCVDSTMWVCIIGGKPNAFELTSSTGSAEWRSASALPEDFFTELRNLSRAAAVFSASLVSHSWYFLQNLQLSFG